MDIIRELREAIRLAARSLDHLMTIQKQAEAHIPRFATYVEDGRTGWVCSCGAFSKVFAADQASAEQQHLLHVEAAAQE